MASKADGPETVSAKDASEALQAGTHTLLDVRSAAQHEIAHPVGALSVPLGSNTTDEAAFVAEIRAKFPNLHQALICHCGGGTRGPRAAAALRAAGYCNALVMSKGMRGWEAAGLPTAGGLR